MKTKRVFSTESSIYHRPNCRYVKKIYKRNKMALPQIEVREYGYRPCKCCNTMMYQYLEEQYDLDYFRRKWNLEFLLKDGILYIKTTIGFWKLVYSRKEEKIVLYHRNNSRNPVDLTAPQRERYHRQSDCALSKTISALCKYIYEHDRFREAQQNGHQLTDFTSARARILAERARKKEKHKRLDALFAKLEKENAGYRELSFC